MSKRCPKCTTENQSNRFTCTDCGAELSSAGYQMDTLTYWDEQADIKLTAICSTIIVAGVLCSILIHNIIPTVAGLVAAGIYYVAKFKS